MKSKLAIFLSFVFLIGGNLRAEDAPTTPEAPKKPWKSVTEFSLISSNGNTRSESMAGKETFNYDWSKTSLELIGSGYGASDKGTTLAERYLASEKMSYKLSDRNYAFEKFQWDKDRFSGISDRYESTLGLGRELIKTKRNNLIGELGGGYLAEDRIGDENKGFATGRAYSKYVFTISETSNFSQDAEYIHNFEDPEDFRTKTESAITANINSHFAMKVTYIWKNVQKPPPTFGRNDTIVSVALVATY